MKLYILSFLGPLEAVWALPNTAFRDLGLLVSFSWPAFLTVPGRINFITDTSFKPSSQNRVVKYIQTSWRLSKLQKA